MRLEGRSGPIALNWKGKDERVEGLGGDPKKVRFDEIVFERIVVLTTKT